MSDQTGKNWNDDEIEAVVAAYFEMLELQLDGTSFVKAQIVRDLQGGRLSGRTRPSVEYKFRNISAVMEDEGCVWVQGYLPAAHKQEALRQRVLRELDDRGRDQFEAPD